MEIKKYACGILHEKTGKRFSFGNISLQCYCYTSFNTHHIAIAHRSSCAKLLYSQFIDRFGTRYHPKDGGTIPA
jgi:hypothetical protein